jgi:hypothetical protein
MNDDFHWTFLIFVLILIFGALVYIAALLSRAPGLGGD